MSTNRRNFTKEQKLEIVKQSMKEGVTIEDLAQQYRIHPNSCPSNAGIEAGSQAEAQVCSYD